MVTKQISHLLLIQRFKKTQKLIKYNKGIKFKKVIFDRSVSKVSVIGVGMITTPGVTYRMFQALSKKNKYLAISTSEIKISVIINRKNVKKQLPLYIKNLND